MKIYQNVMGEFSFFFIERKLQLLVLNRGEAYKYIAMTIDVMIF